VTHWPLIVVAVVAAGCEQLRSPKRIAELEDRVTKLTTEVTALKATAALAPHDDHAGSGSAGEPPPGDAATGTAGDAPPGPQEGADRAVAVASPATDAGTPDTVTPDAARSDPQQDEAKRDAAAMDNLLAVVSHNTNNGAARPDEPRWAYDGKTGPPTWGTLDPAWNTCLAGKAQSPIDIEPRAGTATPIVFHYKPTPATIIDSGRTLQVNLAAGSTIEIDDVPYDLLQFHFHAPSEHTIAGEHYPLEVHLVHKDLTGKLAMIAVLYDVGAESKALAGLWSAWPRKVGVEDKLKKPFDPGTLLPETRTVFRYSGSLTTPPCTEGVLWNVMRRTLGDTRAQLDAFTQHYPRNIRNLQLLGDRKIQ
jgi:carbonic anhydrase